MRSYSRYWLVVLGVLLALAPVCAQDSESETTEPTEDVGLGTIMVEMAYWVAQPIGNDFEPASRVNPNNAFDTRILEMPSGTQARPRVRAGYAFRDNIGEFVLTYWSQSDRETLDGSDPGRFVFGELPVFPLFAGVFDDGRADAFESESSTSSRDLRLDFYRVALEGKRIQAKWFIGMRRVFHQRRFDGLYYALAPNLPLPVGPGGSLNTQLEPPPDSVSTLSRFEGRGLEAGLEARMPIIPKVDLWLETGFAVASLRGKTDASYSSRTFLFAEETSDGYLVLVPPFDEFGDPALVENFVQLSVPVGVKSSARSTGMVLDVFAELRWKAWKGLEAFAGFRNTRYEDVAATLRLAGADYSANGVVNLERVDQSSESIEYEGFYFGLTYRY